MVELLQLMTPVHIVSLFVSLLLERRVIFLAEQLHTLSYSVQAISSLLYPFMWQVCRSQPSIVTMYLMYLICLLVAAHLPPDPPSRDDHVRLRAHALLHWHPVQFAIR